VFPKPDSFTQIVHNDGQSKVFSSVG